MAFEEFTDPRLVPLYDAWGVDRPDIPFWLALVEDLRASTILDVGCGTGEITVALVERGRHITGVDPAARMIEVARQRPGGHLVRWMEGDASAYAGPPVDLALMTAHVAQVIWDDATWHSTLAGIARVVRPGRYLAFESRNPRVEGWRTWVPEHSRRWLEHPTEGAVEVWSELGEVRREAASDLVRCVLCYRFPSGETLTSTAVLRFRSREAVQDALAAAGFEVVRVAGDWDGSPSEEHSPEMIFVARRL